MSHYNYRQIKHGASKHLRTICARAGHTHQRMCRELGDLSADVPSASSSLSRSIAGDGPTLFAPAVELRRATCTLATHHYIFYTYTFPIHSLARFRLR